jgi:hypothetical protein
MFRLTELVIMPERSHSRDVRTDQLDGPQISYSDSKEQVSIWIPIGEDSPLQYHLIKNGQGNVLKVQRDSSDIYEFKTSENTEFQMDHINSGGVGGSDDNAFYININIPEGIQYNHGSAFLSNISNLIATTDQTVKDRLSIPINQEIVDGQGLDALRFEAELTQFETELFRILTTNYVDRVANERGYDFTSDMTAGVVNVILFTLAMELANTTEGGDD